MIKVLLILVLFVGSVQGQIISFTITDNDTVLVDTLNYLDSDTIVYFSEDGNLLPLRQLLVRHRLRIVQGYLDTPDLSTLGVGSGEFFTRFYQSRYE